MLKVKHPWNGIDQEVQENSLEALILKCGKCFNTLEARNDGYVCTGILYSDLDRLRTNGLRFVGKGTTMEESVNDLYSQLLIKWLEIGQVEDTLKDAGYNTGIRYN